MRSLLVRAILFDLFETLITESRTRPPGVSSLGPALGCERAAFRVQWKALRPAVMVGRLSFRQALINIATRLGGHADEDTLQRVTEERIRVKAEPFEHIEDQILTMIAALRGRDVRLGLISNGFAEDVAAWPGCALAPSFDCAIFSCEVGLAKPDRAIYVEATRRLQVDAADTWFIGDGLHEELPGAERAGIRAFRALWFLRRWPNFRDEPCGVASLASVEEVLAAIDESTGSSDR